MRGEIVFTQGLHGNKETKSYHSRTRKQYTTQVKMQSVSGLAPTRELCVLTLLFASHSGEEGGGRDKGVRGEIVPTQGLHVMQSVT